jgi:phosphoglycolate phosphatase
MYRHLIWDWNGTLLNDAWLCVDIINSLLEERGIERVTAERYAQIFGFPLEGYCRKLGFDLERESYEELSDRFMEAYEQRRLECRLQDGVLELLSEVRGKEIEQSLLSAYRQDTLRELVDFFQLGEYFQAVVGVDNHYGNGKIERGRQRIAEMEHDGEEILLIGDTLHDLEVAEAMGVDCALVPSGHQHIDRLRGGGGKVVACLREVLVLVQ